VEKIKSKKAVLFGTSGLLVVVCLLAFGEKARSGHYHLDGGRGWDLPAATALDAGHVQLTSPVSPAVFIWVDRNVTATPAPVTFSSIPFPKSFISLIWFRLRAPPTV
jgi:hypothetical protein